MSCPLNEATAVFMLKNLCYQHIYICVCMCVYTELDVSSLSDLVVACEVPVISCIHELNPLQRLPDSYDYTCIL